MISASNSPSARSAPHGGTLRGFTLIEVMVVVAIIAILAAIAVPSYQDYVLRGKLVDATNLLSAKRADMERFFQDNRTYKNGPCTGSSKYFNITCSVGPTDTAYTLQAAGINTTLGTFTVDSTGQQATVAAPSSWGGASANCWILKRGQTC